jgi:TRAP-type C4-dicarboxylate transport system permease small subunit
MDPTLSQEAGRSVKARHRPKWAVLGWLDLLNAAVLNALAATLGILACLGIAQVVARYVLKSPLAWSEEVIRFALIWCVFLGAGVAVRKGMLVAVEAIYIFVPSSVARFIGYFAVLVSMIFWSVLVYFGWTVTGMVGSLMSGSLELPMRFVYLAIPVGALLALVNTIAAALDPPESVIVQAAS